MFKGTNNFVKNDFSWNNNASMLYLDHPAGVGFSTCDYNISGDCDFDDEGDSLDNVAFLVEWFKKFPEYKGHDLWISGESYGGIYVPWFMYSID